MNACGALSGAWVAYHAPSRRCFERDLRDPRGVQERLLLRTLRANTATVYGRRHGFAGITSFRDFRERIPLTTFDDYAPYVDRIRRGERRVLTRARVRRLVPSSGSTAACKLVPYTSTLQAELGRAIGPWIADLYGRRPDLARGPAYWSVSPATPAPVVPSAVPIGFETDSAYLGGVFGRIVDRTLAVPGLVARVADADAHRYLTLLFLLRARELRLISVWHPSFLTLLLEALEPRWGELVRDVELGDTASAPSIDAEVRLRLRARLRPDPGRARELRAAGPRSLRVLWPRLGLVSCWGDGHASEALRALSSVLDGVEIQKKGLLATEAFVTIPFEGAHPLAIRSHFFELLDDAGEAHAVDELEKGAEYSVVVTTAGGLYRYRLQDRVRVDGFVARTPSLTFLGKEDSLSDRRGEKLCEAFVAEVLRRTCESLDFHASFAMLAPDDGRGVPGYTLYVQCEREPPDGLAAELERRLADNLHYGHCRRLGQLGPARVFRVTHRAAHAFLERSVRDGQRLGDVKPRALHPADGWSRELEGSYVGAPAQCSPPASDSLSAGR